MSTAYQLAKKAFESETSSFTWEEYLEWHYVNGCVFSRPDLIVANRPVSSKGRWIDIINPAFRFHSNVCDCWHVGILAGNIAKAWEFLPWEMKYMSYERANIPRITNLDNLRRLTVDNKL